MKKVFAILALATAMTACNNETEKTDAPAGDTTKTETPAPATTATPDSGSGLMNKVDSLANKVVDTLKKEGEKAIEKGKEAVKEAVKH